MPAQLAGERAPAAAQQAGQPGRAGSLPRGQRLLYLVLLAVGMALAGRFAWFWFEPARLPRVFGGGLDAGDLALFAALTFVVWHRQVMDILGWLICSRVRAHHDPPPPQAGLRVAFITTFVPSSESIVMLRYTLLSMLAADYPHDTWVLDEGDDPDLRRMCRLLGVRHFSRHGLTEYHQDRGVFLTKSKAGNHNAWYSEHGCRYDIVAQIDSDFKVRPDFLTRTLGYFRNPRVGFVGTPQIYGNMGSWIARAAGQQTFLFYGPVMRALSSIRMTLLIGANHIVRIAALRDIGWYQGHLTEDLATGMRFHAARWESVYVPEALAIGEGPTSWADYFNQQYRWAFGCLNIFFTHVPRVARKMRLPHAVLYFFLGQFYLSGLALATSVALLTGYYLFGWAPASLPLEQLGLWYGPLLAWRQLIPLWLARLNVRPEERGLFWAGRYLTIAVLPVYFLALLGVIRNKRVTFKTTPKGGAGGGTDRLAVFRPHLIISAVIVAGLSAAVTLGHTRWVFLAWGAVTAGLLCSFPAGQLFARLIGRVSLAREGRAVPLAQPGSSP